MAKTPFKLRSGNASSFKNLGSSPAKQKGDNLKRIMSETKDFKKKTGTWYKTGAEPKVKVPDVKGFNVTGSSATEKILTKQEKSAKHKQNFDARQASKQKGKQFVKGLKKFSKIVGGKTLGVAGMLMGKTASADQPGTGKHGGKKMTKYNPKTGKYE